MKVFGIIKPEKHEDFFCTLVFKNEKDNFFIQGKNNFINIDSYFNDLKITKINNPKEYKSDNFLLSYLYEDYVLIGTFIELKKDMEILLYSKKINPLVKLVIAKKLKLSKERIDILVSNAKKYFKNRNMTIDYSVYYSG